MNPWIAKSVVILASIVLVVIRAPHGQRSRQVPVVKDGKGRLEVALLTVAWIAFFLPLVWVAVPVLTFAEYASHPVPLVAGVLLLAWGLWLFHRSHVDLGANWSITLQVRQDHRLVTEGLYRRIRHPMYLALLIYGAGLALVVPNWLVGPSYTLAMLLLVAFRLGPEERLMSDAFGAEYDAYARRTQRLIPGVW